MKYASISNTFILLFFFLVSCEQGQESKLIVGEWQGTEWLVDGHLSVYDGTATRFSFMEDGSFFYTYYDTKESGEYYIRNKELFTTPEAGIKMMVKIKTLTSDSLVFDMNRGGTKEQLTLVRINSGQSNKE